MSSTKARSAKGGCNVLGCPCTGILTRTLDAKGGCDILVAVAGNPNVGKSTLFNVLTGEIAHVANWPGTTVMIKRGQPVEHQGRRICFADLPGIYGISASSPEELAAREYIISDEPDLILVLVDSTAPERTMYLPVQILELNPKVIVALTKIDLTHSYGIHIHVDKLEKHLGVPIIPVSALKGIGMRELLNTIVDAAEGRLKLRKTPLRVDYGSLEPYISEVANMLLKAGALRRYPARWAAVRLLEGDPKLEEELRAEGKDDLLERVGVVKESVRRFTGREASELLITARFEFVDTIARDVIVRVERDRGFSRMLENLLQRPIIGPITSILMLFSAFLLAFAINIGFPLNLLFRMMGLEWVADLVETYSLSGILSMAFDWAGTVIGDWLTKYGVADWLVSLLVDGVIPGVGSVLTFLPLIMLSFAFLSALEDSGIGPRIAVAFNTLFSRFGLTGRAIYPYLISLGCNVPGVMASRSAIEEEERVEIIYSTQFIPCQARLVVLLAFTASYFRSPLAQTTLIIVIYMLGFAIALFTAFLVRKVLFKLSEPPELVLEIPPIHRPSGKVIWWTTWDFSKHFLRKAGTIIFALSIATWYLLSYGPLGPAETPETSWGGIIGRAIAPALILIGVTGEKAWKIGFLLLNGFIAKEGLVEAAVLVEGASSLPEALRGLGLTVPQVISLLVFSTLYVPCLATLSVIYQETRRLKHTFIAVLYALLIATAAGGVSYLISTALGL